MNTPMKVLTLPLSQADCQQAERRATALCDPQHLQCSSAIARQIKYNTLAILAAQYYLKLLGIASELSQPLSAINEPPDIPEDLTISSAWRLQCLPIVAGEPLTYSTPTSPLSRYCSKHSLGALAIQINLPHREAQILGFLPSAQSSALPLVPVPTQQTFWAFPSKLPPLQPVAALIARLSESLITHLQLWLIGQFETGWQQLSSSHLAPQLAPRLASRPALQPALRPCFRSSSQPESHLTSVAEAALLEIIRYSSDDEQRWQAAEQLWNLNPTHPESPILRTKDMGLYLRGHSVTLLVGVLAKPNRQRLILVRLLPTGEKPYLPHNLSLTGLDVTGDTVFSIQSRQQDDYIQFKFTAAVGDRFQLCINWNAASVTEQFIV